MTGIQTTPNTRRFRAPKTLAESPCQHCFHPLGFGTPVAACEACGTVHHFACWDERGGCSRGDCINAPFKELRVDSGLEVASCRRCGAAKSAFEAYCSNCLRDDEGSYHGEKVVVSEAKKAVIQAVIGFLIFGIVLGPLAVRNTRKAKNIIRSDPTYYKGTEMANVGLILGLILIGLWVVGILSLIGKLGGSG